MSITEKLLEPFPPQAIKTRQGGGGKRLSYVEGHTVIHRLIAATGNQFDLRVLSVDQKGDLMTALVELTIPGLGSRQHMGVQKIAPNSGEDLVKGAITDAMKKAATLFGVGLDLYGPDYAGEAEPPATDEAATLDTIRNDLADPKARRQALHAYYAEADTIMELTRRDALVKRSGLPDADREAGYRFHHERLAALFAPAGAAS